MKHYIRVDLRFFKNWSKMTFFKNRKFSPFWPELRIEMSKINFEHQYRFSAIGYPPVIAVYLNFKVHLQVGQGPDVSVILVKKRFFGQCSKTTAARAI